MTLGIDLASQPKETGAALIDWSATPARVVDLGDEKLDDARLLELLRDPAVGKAGIDAPFGWPLAFADAISTYRDQGAWLDLPVDALRFRATELEVSRLTGQAPLSVAMSDLAWPAMRLARLITVLAQSGSPVDRSGSGLLVEVYPAAALRRWEVIPAGTSVSAASYKGFKPGREDRRRSMMETLRARLDGVVAIDDATFDRCVADDDDLDALVSALVARTVQVGQSSEIPPSLRWAALREGWIHVPAGRDFALVV